MKTIKSLICLILIAALASTTVAEDQEKKGKRKKRGANRPAATQRLLSRIELTEEQKPKVAAIDEQFAERLTTIRKDMAAVLTREQRKARRQAMQQAKEAGKKGKELRQAVDAALKLTDEQKAQRSKQQLEQQALNAEIITALKGVLTAEQQELLPRQKKQRKGKGKKGKKNRKKKKDAA